MGDTPEPRRPVQVGVLLGQPPQELGGWLADAAAFDAAGADALWLDAAGDAGLDPLAVAAALATLTFRSLLVTPLPEAPGEPRALARTLATIGRLSRGRVALCGGGARFAEVTAAGRGQPGMAVFHRLDDDVFERTAAAAQPQRWVRTAAPAGRAAWRAAVADATEREVDGLLVPAGPQLLDILRNPHGRGDRRDLQIAQG
jgi:hypothetical protein